MRELAAGASSADGESRPSADGEPDRALASADGERSPGLGAQGDYTAGSTRKGNAPVISPRIDRLLEQVDSNYASVLVAAKRARQINSYYHNLGEGTFDEFPPPMVESASKNYLTIALEEVAAGKLKYHYR
jgi:DNA-directed RNA polymerase subunit omega